MSQSDYIQHKKNRALLSKTQHLEPVIPSQKYLQLKRYTIEHDLMDNNTKITYNRLPNKTKIHLRNMEVVKPSITSNCLSCNNGELQLYINNRNIQLTQKESLYKINTLNYFKNKLKEYSVGIPVNNCENITQDMIDKYIERDFCHCDTYLQQRDTRLSIDE